MNKKFKSFYKVKPFIEPKKITYFSVSFVRF